MPNVSVVVRAFNEEAFLPDLFDVLDRQTLQDFEVVVVDSHSYDRTNEIAAERADKVLQVERHNFTFGHSLNVGIAGTEGRHIAILSAHALPIDETWLERLVGALDRPKTGMVYGRQMGTPDSKFSETLDFQRTFGTEPRILRPPEFFANNANSAILRDLWEEHPFDETLPGLEDIEWAKHWMERGRHIVYEPGAAVYHIHREMWPQVRRRYFREAMAARWIGVRKRRHIPSVVLQESKFLAADLWSASRTGLSKARLKEIVRFRHAKLFGTVAGLWDGARVQNPGERERLYFDKPYRAVVIRAPNQAALEERVPPELAPGECLVRVAYVGVCATDLEVHEGSLAYYQSGGAEYPIVPGHEVSGTITEVGTLVTDLEPGDRVVVESIQNCGDCAPCRQGNAAGCRQRRELGVIRKDGAYAEYLVVPARFVHRIPDALGLRHATLCEPAAVVLKGLRRVAPLLGPGPQRVAVVGAGTIGHLAAQFLQLQGHRLTVFDTNDKRLELLRRIPSPPKTVPAPEELSPYRLIIEATGSAEALQRVLDGSPAGCTILLLGLPYAQQRFNFESLVAHDKTILGSVGSTSKDFLQAIELLPTLHLDVFHEASFPLERFREAWAAQRAGKALKIQLAVHAESDLPQPTVNPSTQSESLPPPAAIEPLAR